jgi:hypothetical protein
MESRLGQGTRRYVIPIKRVEMPEIENETVPLGNRTKVECIVAESAKEHVSTSASFGETLI